ncbi:Retinal-binding protein like [Argiope bruennichi]|uniref:Retinal-binding protein like n=1 Tax=Argiope bruennichi TaxID=94029 RepID=A0A8T0FQY6_ARGBR|nr:Retinal-binding protein like [Argiope bruennichi]
MDAITDDEKKVVEELSILKSFTLNMDNQEPKEEHIMWRKEFGVDTILEDYKPPEFLVKYAPVSFICFDKDGCVVRAHDCGRVDSKGLASAVKQTEILKYMIYITELDKERMIKLNEKGKKRMELGKPVLSPIYDFDELTYAKAVSVKSLQLITAFLKLFIDNYPELLKVITVINAPFYFSWIYAAVKPILPPRVIDKVRIYGSDGWKEVLLEDSDADDLPAYLGGTRTDPDGNPLCETFIMRGQTIPKDCYMQKRKKKLALEPDVQKFTVMPFSKEEITFKVTEENSYLEWEFETKSRDIDFSVHFKGESEEDSEPVMIIPKQRIDTCYETEKGCFKCEKRGNYIIVFSNTFSWIRSKEIYYRAGIKNQKNSSIL